MEMVCLGSPRSEHLHARADCFLSVARSHFLSIEGPHAFLRTSMLENIAYRYRKIEFSVCAGQH